MDTHLTTKVVIGTDHCACSLISVSSVCSVRYQTPPPYFFQPLFSHLTDMPPEYVKHGKISPKLDAFAFGKCS
jgi:hypothetical protein